MSKSQYPRGTPYKPPEDENGPDSAQVREAQLRRWMIQVALGTIIVVVLIVGTGVFFVQRAMGRSGGSNGAAGAESKPKDTKPTAVARPDEPLLTPREPLKPKEPAVTVSAEDKKQLQDQANQLAERARQLEEEAKQQKDPAEATRLQKEAKTYKDRNGTLLRMIAILDGAPARERALEAIGGLSAAHLYQSYLNIGMLADAAENEVYSTDDAKKLLSTILDWMENVDQQFQRLGTATLEEADQKRVTQVRDLTAVLRTEAKELRAYWDTPETDMDARKDHEMKFHKSREAAWNGIKELLGIKDE